MRSEGDWNEGPLGQSVVMRNPSRPFSTPGSQASGIECVMVSVPDRGRAEQVPAAPGHRRVRLSDLPTGASGRVRGLAGEPGFCVRLREMGFCESAVIEKIAGNRMLICQLCGIRIALSDAAASHILVEPF